MLRRGYVATSFTSWEHGSHIKVDEDEVYATVPVRVHHIVDANVSVKDICFVTQIMEAYRTVSGQYYIARSHAQSII